MSDLISRKGLLLQIEKDSDDSPGWYGDTWQFIKTIKSMPSTDQWIPFSERSPEEHEWIGTKKFGTTISDKVHITFDVNGERFVKTLSLQNGELSNHEKHIMDTFYKGWKMIAWMPLPEPYKEDGEQ